MKTFQDWCIRMLAVAFMGKDRFLVAGGSGKMEKGYDYVICNALLGQYPQIYTYNGRNFSFYDVDYHKKELRGKSIWKNLLCSKAAADAASRLESGVDTLKEFKKVAEDYPYYEHIEPRSYTFDRIMGAQDVGIDVIKESLRHSKLVMLTTEEAAQLDGAGKRFVDEDVDLVKSWKDVIGDKEAEEAVNSMKKGGSWLWPKSSGSAYARIAHLINKGVELSWGKSSVDPKAVNDIRVIREYLDSNDWTVREFV